VDLRFSTISGECYDVEDAAAGYDDCGGDEYLADL